VQVYGVDDRFWQFHGVAGATDRPAATPSSAARWPPTSARPTAAPSSSASSARRRFPIESLHGQKEDPAARSA
jgi:hypothetical protein